MNINELKNSELVESIVEDLDDLPEDSAVTYEVWALGYDAGEDSAATEDEVLIGEFTDPEEAIKCAEAATLELIEELGYGDRDPETAYFSIEVETVVPDPEEEGTMNLGTVYSRELWLDGEYGSEEDLEPPVELTNSDYLVLRDDNTLEVSCKLLKDFNKNDYVKIKFVDEPDAFILTYKIFSKVTGKDGDYYQLEFIY